MRRKRALRVTGLLVLALFSLSLQANTTRIMSFGDSDVGGAGIYISYRYDLWLHLIDAGFDVDFVGGNRTVVFDPNLYPRVDEFDRDHEGYPGFRLEQMIEIAPMLMQEFQPDVVLLMSSSNICTSGTGAPDVARGLYPELIRIMRLENPDVHFVLGTPGIWVFPCEPNAPDIIPDFSQAIADVVELSDTPRSRVLLVDNYTGFNFDTMFDTVNQHSNRLGEMFIAGRWFDVLEDFLPTIQAEGSDFVINAGLNDAWLNLATLGQGFFITVFPDTEMMFLAWFTYDTERPAGDVMANLGEPGHRWLTAFGPYSGNTATLEVELTSGGVFDAPAPAAATVTDGTIMVEFEGCNAAMVSYDILSANVAGEIPIERIAPDNVGVCEALSE